MRIGVIGSSGFIGTAFIKEALKFGHIVYGWDLIEPQQIFKDKNFQFHKWEKDVVEEQELLKKCDGILILASRRFTSDFGTEDYVYNIQIVLNILNICKKYNIKNVVLLSSISVYSEKNYPWKEKDSNIALNLYGASKIAIDELIKLYNVQYGFTIKSLRLAQVIGMGERKGYLLNTFIEKARKKETLSIWGAGAGRRQYVYIKDVVSAIFAAFGYNKGAIFNIGIEGSISAYELAIVINRVFGNDGNIQFEENRIEDLQHREMDVSKAKEELKWRTQYTVESAMIDLKNIIDGEKKSAK